MLSNRLTQVLALAAWLGLVACVNPAASADAAPAPQEEASMTEHVRSGVPVRNQCDAQAGPTRRACCDPTASSPRNTAPGA